MPRTPNLTNTIVSFIGLGIFIILLICALIFLSYVFVIGAAFGLILFLISYIRALFIRKKYNTVDLKDGKQHRIIDNDEK